MISTEFLIIGQGISGTWLSYNFHLQGREFLVIDPDDPNASSRIAAGVINPVTGRRHVSTWMAEELLPFAHNSYQQIGTELGINAISEKSIIDFFPTAQMRVSFMERLEENAGFLHKLDEENKFADLLKYEFGCAEIKPVYTVNLQPLLTQWRKKLIAEKKILGEKIDVSELKFVNGRIIYRDIIADQVIFCDGNCSMEHPWFRSLPFAPNKGEIIIAEIADLPPDHIYKKGMVLVPLDEPGIFWIGSSYEWEFENDQPTADFKRKTAELLKNFLKIPFKIIDHKAGLRPATLERRPFVGRHPQFPNIAILNGMGTKGCSLAPYFAKQLTEHLINGTGITPEADISRFRRILSSPNHK